MFEKLRAISPCRFARLPLPLFELEELELLLEEEVSFPLVLLLEAELDALSLRSEMTYLPRERAGNDELALALVVGAAQIDELVAVGNLIKVFVVIRLKNAGVHS